MYRTGSMKWQNGVEEDHLEGSLSKDEYFHSSEKHPGENWKHGQGSSAHPELLEGENLKWLFFDDSDSVPDQAATSKSQKINT